MTVKELLEALVEVLLEVLVEVLVEVIFKSSTCQVIDCKFSAGGGYLPS